MAPTRTQLAAALKGRHVVTFNRPCEPGSVTGYVLKIGPRFFMVAIVSDEQRLAGYQCFRISDVRSLHVPARNAAFTKQALKLRGERMPKTPRVTVANLPELLTTASRAFPLVTIHRERANPDICQIGRVVDVSKSSVTLLEIGSDAKWDAEPESYRLSEITRVDFGGGYEEALHLVGGEPPV
jgi:hypothetical protein